MKTHGKILMTTLPLVIVSLWVIVETTYFFSRAALVDLGETWLDTRLSEAMVILSSQEKMLRDYGLSEIPASITKAQMDSVTGIADIGVGKLGYMIVVTREGRIVSHPDPRMIHIRVHDTDWFKGLLNGVPRLIMTMGREPVLARSVYFPPWEWYLLAVDPMKEIYGVANRMRPCLYGMGVFVALIISLALMLMTRRLTRPLKDLVQGADRIGKGDLDIRIPVHSRDEFGHLATKFNQMAGQLKETLSALKRSHQDLENRVAERTRNLTLLNQALNNEILVRKQKEQELEKANQAKSDFLANMSHEIRTPINSVIGFSEVLSTLVSEPQQKNYLQSITSAGKHLLTLITNLLDLSKVESGKIAIHATPVSLHTLLDEIHHMFKIKLFRKHLTFSIHTDDHLPAFLLLDEMRIRQVLTNLVDNAVKFTEHGQIRLSAKVMNRPDPDTVDLVIRVRDTGIGIAGDKQQLVFDSFEQEHTDITRKYGGTGLGLTISRQLVALMKGRIELNSQPGIGSCFEVFLPGVMVSRTGKHAPKPSDADPPDISPTLSVTVLSESLIQQALDRHPDLLTQLQTTIFPLLPGNQEGVKMSDARAIADHFMELGRRFDLTAFTQFGQELSDDVDAFDVEKITPCLEQVTLILRRINDI
ncbi:MAG: ATP-binding protein [Desulfotignum sp.]